VTSRPIRVGVDALFVRSHSHAGGEVSLRSLLQALRSQGDGMEFVIFADSTSTAAFPTAPGLETVPVKLPSGRLRTAARFVWQNTLMGRVAQQHRVDVMLFPANLVPARFPVPAVLITNDFSSLFYREHLPHVRRGLAKRVLDVERVRSCRRADVLLTISEFTASETVRIAGVDREQIRVVHLGVRDFQVPDPIAARATVVKYGLRRPFVLAVASLMEHKNLPRLIAAFSSAAKGELASFDLVLVGQPGSGQGEIRRSIEEHDLADRVLLAGFVPDCDLPAFYRAADIFVLPSLYEGFGFPVLEAGTCGTAVAAARAGSLPEVIGDAALLFDPWDVRDIARSLCSLAASPALRDELGRKARERAAQFSWTRTAELVAASLRDATLKGA
jgi:glycosyltransferase involved in cell wall biosynthesis